MKREAIFMSKQLINKLKTEENKNVIFEDMVTGKLYRCYNVEEQPYRVIIRIKNIEDLENGVNDLYMEMI